LGNDANEKMEIQHWNKMNLRNKRKKGRKKVSHKLRKDQ